MPEYSVMVGIPRSFTELQVSELQCKKTIVRIEYNSVIRLRIITFSTYKLHINVIIEFQFLSSKI